MNDPRIAGALFDFAGYLTTRDSPTTFGACYDASPVVKLLTDWAKERGLSLDDAMVKGWEKGVRDGIEDSAGVEKVASARWKRSWHRR